MRDAVTAPPRPALTGPATLIAAASLAVLAAVWTLQSRGYSPCELCLEERIPFTGIAAVIERVLEEMPAAPVGHFADLFAADAEARRRSEETIAGLARV